MGSPWGCAGAATGRSSAAGMGAAAGRRASKSLRHGLLKTYLKAMPG